MTSVAGLKKARRPLHIHIINRPLGRGDMYKVCIYYWEPIVTK